MRYINLRFTFLFTYLLMSLLPDSSDLWPRSLKLSVLYALFREMNYLDFVFMATLYDTYERSYSQKCLISPLVT